MFYYKNKVLTSDDSAVDNAAYTMTLEADIDSSVVLFGQLKFRDGRVKTIEFVKHTKAYCGLLVINEDDIPVLKGATLSIKCVSACGCCGSNTVPVNFDVPKVRQTLKVLASQQLSDMMLEIARLRKVIEAHNSGHTLNLITVPDTSYIKPGMVPVAIEGGTWVAAYPFVDVITEINEQKAVDKRLTLGAEHILFNDGIQVNTIADTLTVMGKAIKGQHKLIKTLLKQNKDVRQQLADLQIEFEKYKNQGLI